MHMHWFLAVSMFVRVRYHRAIRQRVAMSVGVWFNGLTVNRERTGLRASAIFAHNIKS
jgi:hypothetical protein